MSQTMKDFELILVDDGSSDGSEKNMMNIQKQSQCYFASPKNKGVSMARNLGIEMASGDYIVFVDSDDWVNLIILKYFLRNMTRGGMSA